MFGDQNSTADKLRLDKTIPVLSASVGVRRRLTLGMTPDERWMRLAIAEANLARAEGEVPVGAIAVLNDQVIGRGHNRNEALHDPTAHAEIIALSAAGRLRDGNRSGGTHNWRLSGVTLYVTMEPCLMCTGALVLGRVKRVVFGTPDAKFGACGSIYDIPWDNRFNHRIEVRPGIMEEECRQLLQEFFRERRMKDTEFSVRRSTGRIRVRSGDDR